MIERDSSFSSFDDSKDEQVITPDDLTPHAERAHGFITRVNEYKVLSILGKGSYGQVYLVQKDLDVSSNSIDLFSSNDTTTSSRTSFVVSNRYAMKVIIDKKKPDMISRFNIKSSPSNVEATLKEIAIMKSLNHPNLVRLHAIIRESEPPNTVFIIMEYVGFGTIMRKVSADGSYDSNDGLGSFPRYYSPLTNTVMGEALASKSFRGIISAMKYLHSHHIAHRDLKIDNILLDHDGNVKVTDFGVSHVFQRDEDDGKVSDAVGTWAYWSPEMCDDNVTTYDAYKSDVWAAGVCLYVMIYGVLPFWGNTIGELFSSISSGIPSHSQRRSNELIELIERLLDMNPTKRPSFSDASKSEWITQHYLNDSNFASMTIKSRTNSMIEESIDTSTAITSGSVQFSEKVEYQLHKWSQSAKQREKERRTSFVEELNIQLQHSIVELEEMEKESNISNNNDDDDDFFSTPRTDRSGLRSPTTANRKAMQSGCNCIIN